jgi:hypothetical protein
VTASENRPQLRGSHGLWLKAQIEDQEAPVAISKQVHDMPLQTGCIEPCLHLH